MNFLGIDYGTKRVGIATGNTETSTAFPRSVLDNTKTAKNGMDGMSDVVSQIIELAQAEKAEKIIVGESKDFSGQENTIMPEVHALVKMLMEAGCEVVLEPEYLSSAQAERLQGKNDMLDASAAAVILQSYLDKLKAREEI